MSIIERLIVLSGELHWILAIGTTLFGVGTLFGLVVALVLTRIERGYGKFHLMLNRDAARIQFMSDNRMLMVETEEAAKDVTFFAALDRGAACHDQDDDCDDDLDFCQDCGEPLHVHHDGDNDE